jgi:hypothetical protein
MNTATGNRYEARLNTLIEEANRSAEYHALAGIDDAPDPLAELALALTVAVATVGMLRSHRHQWVTPDDPQLPTHCAICGWNGDA